MSDAIELFQLAIPQAELDDLSRRLAATRWPDPETVDDTSQGPLLAKLRALVERWQDGYDWRACDYPASDPLVVGCGGTRITASAGRITRDVVWKSNGGGTGGGVSDLYAKPDYQADATVPPATTARGGRGVPDVAGNAAPDSGYRVVTGGRTDVVGGTSAVAPLWAAIVAGLNGVRATTLGDPHVLFYANPAVFRDITHGNNRAAGIGYAAGKGWDPCTGLGSPVGVKLRALAQDDKALPAWDARREEPRPLAQLKPPAARLSAGVRFRSIALGWSSADKRRPLIRDNAEQFLSIVNGLLRRRQITRSHRNIEIELAFTAVQGECVNGSNKPQCAAG